MKVAIVGGAPSSEGLAPFDDESWEVWVHGNQMDRHKGRRFTGVFEIHEDLTRYGPDYAGWLTQIALERGAWLMVSPAFPIQAEHVLRFPFDEARKFFGRDMLTSTPAYMMALALIRGAEEIGIWGVDMAVDDPEYFEQQPVMCAWIGYAMGKGVRVTVAESSPLMRPTQIEGQETRASLGPFSHAQLLEMAGLHAQHHDGLDRQLEALRLKQAAHEGARQAYERLAKVARAVEAGQPIESLTGQAVIKA